MAFPSILGSATTSVSRTATATDTVSVAVPAGAVSGNVILILITCTTGFGGSWNVPAGWTSYRNEAGSFTGSVLAGVSDGTETSITLTRTAKVDKGVAAVCLLLDGTAMDKIELAAIANNTSNAIPPSLTLTTGAADNLWLTSIHYRDQQVQTQPADFTFVNSADSDAVPDAAYCYVASNTTTLATEDPDGGYTNSDFGDAVALTIGLAPGTVVVPPSLTVTPTDLPLTPGSTISGTYADYDTVPTTLTVSDGTNTITIASPTINDNGDGTGDFSGTMPALPTTGTASLVLFGDVTVELA